MRYGSAESLAYTHTAIADDIRQAGLSKRFLLRLSMTSA